MLMISLDQAVSFGHPSSDNISPILSIRQYLNIGVRLQEQQPSYLHGDDHRHIPFSPPERSNYLSEGLSTMEGASFTRGPPQGDVDGNLHSQRFTR